MISSIDIVILWVDGSDREWIRHKNLHASSVEADDIGSSAARYRDWDNLQYIFRGIDVFMPWVRKVHFVTSGHKPDWLNVNYPKVNFVKHSDYIPKKYLPTFSSHPIELNIHRIKDLSEKFIYFNDDTFITRPLKESDFFRNGTPAGMAVNTRIESSNYNDPMSSIALNGMAVINNNFNFKDVIKSNPLGWINSCYGLSNLVRSASYLPYPSFTGILTPHLPAAFLKSTFEEVWETEPTILNKVSLNKFRTKDDVNQYLMQNWQLASGKFWPKNLYKNSSYFNISDSTVVSICAAIEAGKFEMICINDVTDLENFEELRDSFEI